MMETLGRIRMELYRKLLYPIYEFKTFWDYRYGINIVKIFEHLKHTERFSSEEMADYQNYKFRKLVCHVYENVPYYRKVMERIGLHPKDVRGADDVRLFPILTKDIIRENPTDLISRDVKKRRVAECSTGGSTGEPLKFYRDVETNAWTEAALLRGRSFAGCEMGCKIVHFLSCGRASAWGKIRESVLNYSSFPAFECEQSVLKYMHNVRLLKPLGVTGYASNLYRMAVIINKNGMRGIQIPKIFSTGEMLYDYQRRFIEKEFGGEVFDYYGCTEVGSLAYECEYHNKHVTDEHVIIETTNSDGQLIVGALGEITITDLDNYGMPFIRYKNSDIGVMSNDACECGRGLRVLESLEGRNQDYLKSHQGELIPAIFFPSQFSYLKGLDQYQVIQKDIDNITLRIVKNERFSAGELTAMVDTIKQKLGNEVNVRIEECEHINLTGRGKSRLVISYVPTEI